MPAFLLWKRWTGYRYILNLFRESYKGQWGKDFIIDLAMGLWYTKSVLNVRTVSLTEIDGLKE